MVECAGLLSRCTCKGTPGSNPGLSAILYTPSYTTGLVGVPHSRADWALNCGCAAIAAGGLVPTPPAPLTLGLSAIIRALVIALDHDTR